MKTPDSLFLDCSAGASGDMMVAALLDLGLPAEELKQALSVLGLDAEFHFHITRESRCNIDAVRFHVHDHGHHSHDHKHDHKHDHEHHHAHDHEHGRSFAEIRELLRKADLPRDVRNRSEAVFFRIAKAEGKIHGMPPEKVTFHEVGAIDSIVDIVAVCWGIHRLGIQKVFCSSLIEGTGTVLCAHGNFPLPAPATLEILTGIPLSQIDEPGERITPTGAALIAEFSDHFGPMTNFTIQKIGYGAGSRNPSHYPNVLRALLGFTPASSREQILEIRTNLDDFSPELLSALCEDLMNSGAAVVFTVPATMKKGRMGSILHVLCAPDQSSLLEEKILTHSSAFGLRKQLLERTVLERTSETVETEFGPVEIKCGFLNGRLVQAVPEFESCRKAATAHGVATRSVFLAAQKAAPPIL